MPLGAAGPSSDDAFRSGKARDARTTYVNQIRKAEDDYRMRAQKATREYRDTLEEAKGIATRSGDLDGANALRELIKDLDEQLSLLGQKTTGPGLIVYRARWGTADRWTDVTKLVQSKIDGDCIRLSGPLPDPAYGKQKSLTIEGAYGGRPFTYQFNTVDPPGNFYFGGRPPPVSTTGDAPASNVAHP
jgi:hypothetical protein